MQGVAATLYASTAGRLRIDYLPRVLLGTLLARGCMGPSAHTCYRSSIDPLLNPTSRLHPSRGTNCNFLEVSSATVDGQKKKKTKIIHSS